MSLAGPEDPMAAMAELMLDIAASRDRVAERELARLAQAHVTGALDDDEAAAFAAAAEGTGEAAAALAALFPALAAHAAGLDPGGRFGAIAARHHPLARLLIARESEVLDDDADFDLSGGAEAFPDAPAPAAGGWHMPFPDEAAGA